MNILILGGTQFVGRAIAERALAQGHEVTLFHRGRTGADLFPAEKYPLCRHLLGDRIDDIGLAEGVCWDAVLDVSCYLNGQASAATRLNTDFYCFVSTISVYDLVGQSGPLNEATPILPSEEADEVTPANYGPLKVRCEEILKETFDDRLAVVRPGIVFGPHDPTGRFPYWVSRLDLYDEVLAIDQMEQPLQWIDVRDLAEFCVSLVENRKSGMWNAVGPRTTVGSMFKEILRQVGKTSDSQTFKFVLASHESLETIGVRAWIDLPLMYKSDDRWVTFNFDPAAAQANGLSLRSIEETVSATLEWIRSEPEKISGKYGMSRDREVEAIKQVKGA